MLSKKNGQPLTQNFDTVLRNSDNALITERIVKEHLPLTCGVRYSQKGVLKARDLLCACPVMGVERPNLNLNRWGDQSRL